MTLAAPPYGRDTSCTDQMRRGRLVSGGELLGQAAYRRLTTDRGTLLDGPSYGLLVSRLLNADISDDGLASIPGQIRAELLKDPRLDEVAINITQTPITRGGSVELTIDIQGRGANGDGFALSLLVGEVRVELLNLEAA